MKLASNPDCQLLQRNGREHGLHNNRGGGVRPLFKMEPFVLFVLQQNGVFSTKNTNVDTFKPQMNYLFAKYFYKKRNKAISRFFITNTLT